MTAPLRRHATLALTVGTLAAAGLYAFVPASTEPARTWRPATYGLGTAPERLLPRHVDAAHPVRVVGTSLDAAGRPVIAVRTAVDRASAAAAIRAAQHAPRAVGVALDTRAYALDAPTGSDPMRAQQWDLATMNVSAAWQRSTGAGVTVAVVDTGVDSSHPDLSGQVLDGIDLVAGTTGPATDPNGHGTHVAGTIAALAGNDIGVAGIAPDARILPIRVLDAHGSGYMSTVAEGITDAVAGGAKVINMSLGATEQDPTAATAVAYALSQGVVVVAAAGNGRSSGSPVSYPAAEPGVLAVASTNGNDQYSRYSNAGDYVSLAAPGESILSTLPSNQYGHLSGTSMASPHVAAAAALLEAYRPGLTPDQVAQALESTAVDLGNPGRDTDYGYGRVDPAAALATLAPSPAPLSEDPSTSTPSPSSPDPAPSSAEPSPSEATPEPDPTSAEPTPSPDPAAPVVPVVTASSAAQTVAYGSDSTTTFTVTADGQPLADQPAQLCLAVGPDGFSCTAVTTSAQGEVVVTRPATANYRLRLLITGGEQVAATQSETVAWSVHAVVSASRAGRRTLAVRITGTTGGYAYVQQYLGRRWTTVGGFRARFQQTVVGLTAGRTYRVLVPGTAMVGGDVSPAVRV